MSLATRCTACGTIFRVVQDQLRVSDGWVRCGRCAEVFDAREQLFDMDREAPPPWPPQTQSLTLPEPVPPEPPARPMARAPSDPTTWAMPAESRRPEVEPDAGSLPVEASADPQLIHGDHEATESVDRREPYWEPEPAAETKAEAPLPEPRGLAPLPPPADDQDVVLAPGLAAAASQATDAAAAPAAAAPVPSFLKRADGQARWQRRPVRLALALACTLLSLGLGAQLLWHFRDATAAIYPQALPHLQAACIRLGCEIKPWKRIDAISVESSALTLAASGNHYKLSLNLRNRSGWELALPWVDLTLTDANGAVVARRALSPAEFNLAKNSLIAGGEQALQLVFNTGKQRVTGYTVEIFHP